MCLNVNAEGTAKFKRDHQGEVEVWKRVIAVQVPTASGRHIEIHSPHVPYVWTQGLHRPVARPCYSGHSSHEDTNARLRCGGAFHAYIVEIDASSFHARGELMNAVMAFKAHVDDLLDVGDSYDSAWAALTLEKQEYDRVRRKAEEFFAPRYHSHADYVSRPVVTYVQPPAAQVTTTAVPTPGIVQPIYWGTLYAEAMKQIDRQHAQQLQAMQRLSGIDPAIQRVRDDVIKAQQPLARRILSKVMVR